MKEGQGLFNDLYQEIILDHYKNPRNTRDLSSLPDDHLHENPTCGDSLKLDIRMENGLVKEVFFDGHGCAVSMASASIMTEHLKGMTANEAVEYIHQFINNVQCGVDDFDQFGELAAFGGLSRFPLRIKCATLAWHAMETVITSIDA